MFTSKSFLAAKKLITNYPQKSGVTKERSVPTILNRPIKLPWKLMLRLRSRDDSHRIRHFPGQSKDNRCFFIVNLFKARSSQTIIDTYRMSCVIFGTTLSIKIAPKVKSRIRQTSTVWTRPYSWVLYGSCMKRSVTWLGMRSLLGLLSRFSGRSPYDYACACVDNTSVSNGHFVSHTRSSVGEWNGCTSMTVVWRFLNLFELPVRENI